MTDHPILFSAPMIRALLDGRKTQTRRVLKQPAWAQDEGWPHKIMEEQELDGSLSWFARETGCLALLPIPQPGDRLWVREAHYLTDDGESEYAVFAADQSDVDEHFADMQAAMTSHPSIDWSKHLRLRPSIFMPRWASRLTLTVTDVRVQRVQEISREDAKAEGLYCWHDGGGWEYFSHENSHDDLRGDPRQAFENLWDNLNAERGFGWDANPWVAAYTFTVHRCNIDQMESANG